MRHPPAQRAAIILQVNKYIESNQAESTITNEEDCCLFLHMNDPGLHSFQRETQLVVPIVMSATFVSY